VYPFSNVATVSRFIIFFQIISCGPEQSENGEY
jgi:hypothetical protein